MLIEKNTEFKNEQLSKTPSPYLYNEDHSFFSNYTTKLATDLKNLDWEIILRVASQLLEAWKKNSVFMKSRLVYCKMQQK